MTFFFPEAALLSAVMAHSLRDLAPAGPRKAPPEDKADLSLVEAGATGTHLLDAAECLGTG